MRQVLPDSKMIMSKVMNNHTWYGLLSTYNTKFGENFDFMAVSTSCYHKGLHQNDYRPFAVSTL